jgi:glyceraldehyde-3-phosphate dehydrogenase/erythrose-4-phosphate dehydrogenase
MKKIAINGFGRIGRAALKVISDMPGLEVVAINDLMNIDNEVAYHKAAINEVENVLIPDATNSELKSLLQSALPIFKTHLAHAEMVQKEFNK